MRIIGIDPGERWCGFAMLFVDDTTYTAKCAVIDTRQQDFTSLINGLTAMASDVVVTERFQTRNVGHQRMHSPVTAQIIGAIRYAAETKGSSWDEVNPGDPSQLAHFPISPYIARWRKMWPMKDNARWNHGLSAWRVLCQYLLMKQPDVLGALVKRPKAHLNFTLPGILSGNTMHAPTVRWSL